METIEDTLGYIQKSVKFKKWIRNNKQAYFVSAFTIDDGLHNLDWKIDFFNPINEKITSFFITGNTIKFESGDIFQKEKSVIKQLNLLDVKINLQTSLNILDDLIQEKYPNEVPEKRIIILQHLEVLIWNITFITTNFNILNVKIDAINGNILEDKIESVLNFKAK